MRGRLLLMLLALPLHAYAQQTEPETWGLHGQFTAVAQWHASFDAPYSGAASLSPGSQIEETTDATLYAGFRPWRSAEIWINPELDQGFGLDDTRGMAGFPSGEAYKVGKNRPYLRLHRLFLRQVIELGGATHPVDAGPNQLAGEQTENALIISLGKLSVGDIFDTNSDAHDPRLDFLNWSIIDSGAFDYAADAWGYTIGGAVEWTQDWWTLRGGVFQLSRKPNGETLDTRFRQYSAVGEYEMRYRWRELPGSIKLLAFANRGVMARYDDALRLALPPLVAPDVALARRQATRPGLALNCEQQLASELGAFLRASANDGSKEAFEFTEINRSLALGLSIKGIRWQRADDRLGLAAVVNGLSGPARRYFAAGGMGILIGDGRLDYGREQILESYYSARIEHGLDLAFDYQYVVNPAYNKDRGPISIFALRLHGEF